MFRYRKTRSRYKNAPKLVDCPFCETEGQGEVIEESSHAYVIQNLFPYDLWEFRNVTEHLLVIPRRHVKSLDELKDDELRDVIRLLAKYEADNYNVYARAVDSVQRTVPLHQHTHLIKTGNKQAKAAVYVKNPYWLFRV